MKQIVEIVAVKTTEIFSAEKKILWDNLKSQI